MVKVVGLADSYQISILHPCIGGNHKEISYRKKYIKIAKKNFGLAMTAYILYHGTNFYFIINFNLSFC